LNLTKALVSNGLPRRTLTVYVGEGRPEELLYVTAHLPKERVERIAHYGKPYGASLNDMIIAAFYRTMAKTGNWDGKKKLRLITTADLRRWYIPEGRGQAIANLSSGEFPHLYRNLGDSFDDTIKNVTKITGLRKQSWFGLNIIIPLKLLETIPHGLLLRMLEIFLDEFSKNETIIPMITNMGPIEAATVNFGKPPIRTWILVPPSILTGFFAGVTGYDGSLTLSAGANPSSRAIYENFFKEMIAQLPD
jgi:NRPS condensation-like uncharacterized protein